jgi:Tfp pilus assembly protein PilO
MKTPALSHAATALLVVMLLGVGYAFWFITTENAAAHADALSSEINAKAAQHAHADTTRDTVSQVEADEATIETHFVPEEEIVSFLEELEALGGTLGSKVIVLSVTDPDGQGRITLALSISGSFDAVMRTVGVVEHGTRVSAVRSLTLDAGSDGMWTAAATVTVLAPPSP